MFRRAASVYLKRCSAARRRCVCHARPSRTWRFMGIRSSVTSSSGALPRTRPRGRETRRAGGCRLGKAQIPPHLQHHRRRAGESTTSRREGAREWSSRSCATASKLPPPRRVHNHQHFEEGLPAGGVRRGTDDESIEGANPRLRVSILLAADRMSGGRCADGRRRSTVQDPHLIGRRTRDASTADLRVMRRSFRRTARRKLKCRRHARRRRRFHPREP